MSLSRCVPPSGQRIDGTFTVERSANIDVRSCFQSTKCIKHIPVNDTGQWERRALYGATGLVDGGSRLRVDTDQYRSKLCIRVNYRHTPKTRTASVLLMRGFRQMRRNAF